MRIIDISVLAACLLCASCATQRVAGPSTAGVEAKIAEAQRYNDLARGTSQRIEAKAAVLEKYWDTSK